MFCSKCGNQNGEGEKFCRKCGTNLGNLSLVSVEQNLLHKENVIDSLANVRPKDVDELTGKGVGNVIIGDGFFMVAIILSATHGSVSSLLWLFLLIPAFFFFGKGLADIIHARQIRRRSKGNELNAAAKIAELPPPRASFIETIKRHTSGELVALPSVTERTTRDL